MATKIDANPFQAGGKINPKKPGKAVMTVLLMVAGFAIFFTALAFGQDAAQKLQNLIGQTLGIESSSGGPSIKVA